MKKSSIYCHLTVIALGAFAGQIVAQDTVPTRPVEENAEEFDAAFADAGSLDPMVVIGSSEAVFDLPGSGFFVEPEAIRQQNYFNVNRVFAKVPGVYVREEDGYGNFPNISIRGGDGTRSENVTIMEDGILTAPATYAAPAAYYSPNAARMSGIEVLKGSSQVRYGPHTTGGVVNYLSTPIPDGRGGYLRSTYGTNNTWQNHGYYGDVIEGDFGRFGFLGEIFYMRADGFRTIDSGIGYGGSDRTGFELVEPMVKVFWEPDSSVYQRFEAKYGYSRRDADETYTGLTERDLARTPYRRYAGTFLDNIYSEQHRTYLKYLIEPSGDLAVQVAGYYNHFERDWYKIRKTGGESIHKVLANPGHYGPAFDTLRLRGKGDLDIRANARSYEAYGLQSTADYDFQTGDVSHSLHGGFRLHRDEIRRFQRDDKIVVGGRGAPLAVRRGEPGSGGNRYQQAEALSLWIEDAIEIGKLTLTPGLRYEYIDMAYTDYKSDSTNTRTGGGTGHTDQFAPGIGLTYALTDSEVLFGGIYQGISAPSPRSFLKDGTDWEKSIGYELGLRHRGDKVSGEIVGFFSDFSNLTGSDAGLGGSDSTNAGEAEVYGVEFLANYDPLAGRSISTPLFISATYTKGTLNNALSGGGGDDILAGGVPGATIPYIPEWKLAAGAGIAAERWGIDLMATYVSDSYGTARNLDRPDDSSRQGRIDSGFIVDLSANYQLTDRMRLVGGVHNLFDEVMTTSRIPEGPRSNAPRQFYAGLELTW